MGNVFGCVNVPYTKVAIEENFGDYKKILDPGCHCVPWWLGRRIVGHVDLRVQEMDLRFETKTKDNVFVNIVASLQYRAIREKADDAFYKLTNPRGQIQAYVLGAIRSKVLKLTLNEVFEQKDDVARAVGEDEQPKTALALYGYEITKIIIDVELDEKTKSGMNDAARLRLAATEKAEAERMSVIQRAEAEAEAEKILVIKRAEAVIQKAEAEAEAEKIFVIKRAEAKAESEYRSGLGRAWKRQAVFDGLASTLLRFKDSVPEMSTKDVMDMVVGIEYLDTLKEIRGQNGSSAEVMPHGPGSVRDVVTQIHQGGLFQGSSA